MVRWARPLQWLEMDPGRAADLGLKDWRSRSRSLAHRGDENKWANERSRRVLMVAYCTALRACRLCHLPND